MKLRNLGLSTTLLVAALPAGACNAPDADASASAAFERAPCDPGALDRFEAPGGPDVDPAELRAALSALPPTTKWADLPQATRDVVTRHATAMRAYLSSRWGADAIAARTAVLLQCPTAELSRTFDTMVPLIHATADLPSGFTASQSVHSSDLLDALKKLHVLYFALMRENGFYRGGAADIDWDGKPFNGTLDGFRPQAPDQAEAIKASAAQIRDSLRSIPDASLSAEEKALEQSALYRARSYATGSFLAGNGYQNGGEDDAVAPATPWMTYWLLNAFTGESHVPKTYPTPEWMLEALNAQWFATPSKWLDMGTTGPGLDYMATGFGVQPQNVGPLASDPQLADVLNDFGLLRSWSIERVRALPGASARCTVFSPAEQDAVWESFSADAFFNNDGSTSMQWASEQTTAHLNSLIGKYRQYAVDAVNGVFPDDSILTADQRATVIAQLTSEPSLVQLPVRVAQILDQVTGNTTASAKFTAAQTAAVGSYGGNYAAGAPARQADVDGVNAMENSLKGWIKQTYSGHALDVPSIVDRIPALKFNTGSSSASTTTPGGVITMGLQAAIGAGQVYRSLMQQTLSALNRVQPIPGYSGVAEQGASWIAQEDLLGPFMHATVTDNTTASLILLDAANQVGTSLAITDATLKRFTRTASPGCSDPSDLDTLAYAKTIGDSWGLTASQTAKLQQRVHTGSQYLVYVLSGVLEKDINTFLQNAVDPTGAHHVDPFVWFACDVPNPQKDQASVDALKTCLHIGG